MPERFACEIFFMSNLGTMREIPAYMYLGGVLVTTIVDIESKGLNLERDVFMPIAYDTEYVNKLEKGTYKMFVIGNVIITETPAEYNPANEPELVFEEKEVRVVQLLDFKPETITLLEEDNDASTPGSPSTKP